MMKKGRYTITHQESGDEHEAMFGTISPFRKYPKGRFFIMSKIFMQLLKSEVSDNLGKTDLKVLFALLERIENNNKIARIRQRDLGEELGIRQSNISRSIIKLKKLGIIYYDFQSDGMYFNDKLVYTGGRSPLPDDKTQNGLQEAFDAISGYTYGKEKKAVKQ